MQQFRAVAPRRSASFVVSAKRAAYAAVATVLACGAATTPAQSPDYLSPQAPQYVLTPTGQIGVAPMVTPSWSKAAVKDLIEAIESAQEEGLNPADYEPKVLLLLLEGEGDAATLNATATRIAMTLARDYFLGRVNDKSRFDWFIERSPYDTLGLQAGLTKAVADDKVGRWLTSLLPDNTQYAELRRALAGSTDTIERDRLRANMERWRWMPRTLGQDYVYVNVPSYRLAVVEDGNTASTYDVVVGKKTTPTPQLSSEISSVVVNPWWTLPASIVREKGLSAGRRGGFVYTGGGFRQPPGPRNALGRLKVDMPNEHAIYLHDTPSKGGFAEVSRTFSHGCIRVKDIDRLAEQLMTLGAGEEASVEGALATSRTATLKLPQRLPVYIVYFTSEVGADGRIVTLEDPYGRDAKLLASLDGRPTQLAMK